MLIGGAISMRRWGCGGEKGSEGTRGLRKVRAFPDYKSQRRAEPQHQSHTDEMHRTVRTRTGVG